MKHNSSKRDGNAFQLETVEPRILFSASLPVPVVELSSGDSSEHVALFSAAESTAHASAYAANGEQYALESVENVIIDAATPDLEVLVDSLENQSNDRLKVYVLDAGQDGIEQISNILAQYDTYK